MAEMTDTAEKTAPAAEAAEKPAPKKAAAAESAAPKPAPVAEVTVTVEQTGSPIRRKADQRATLVGLGLNKLGRRRTLRDTPEVRGMIAKVSHLVRVVG